MPRDAWVAVYTQEIMIRLKARQQEKEQAEKQAAAEPTGNYGSSSSSVTESGKSSRDEDSLEREASSEKKVRIFGIGRGKKVRFMSTQI